MGINRLSRDTILLRALQQADVPTLNLLDVSNANPMTGTILSAAQSIGWLQEIIDWFAAIFPWAQNVTSASANLTAATATIALPTDFILDLRDKMLVTVSTVQRPLRRRGLQSVISSSLNVSNGTPRVYCVHGANLRVAPTPDIAYTGTLWYYQRPAVLAGSDVPFFPSDLVLVEYIRRKALEWIRAIPPGMAQGYAEGEVVKLRKSGLGYEPEEDFIPLDTAYFIPGAGRDAASGWGWMGDLSRG